MISNMEARIRDLQAIQDITNLESECAFAADTAQPDKYADIFTDDAVLDLRPFGERLEGREAIKKFRQDSPKRVAFSVHYLSNPHIVVNGNSAIGRVYWLAALTMADTNEDRWSSGYYLDEFVKTDHGWKIKKRVMTWFFRAPYEKGWARGGITPNELPNKDACRDPNGSEGART